MLMKVSKGHQGYLKARKRSLLFRTLLLFIGIIGLVLIGWVTLKTNKNWLSIVACLSAIPMAMSLATLLSVRQFKERPAEEISEIQNIIGKGVLDYDLIIANREGKSYQLSYVYFHETGIFAFIPDEKTDIKKGQDYIRNFLRLDACDGPLTLYTNLNTYKKKLSSLSPSDRETCDEFLLKQEGVLRAIST